MTMSGPDYISPTNNLTTWDSNSFTKIRISTDDLILQPKSLVTKVQEVCKKGNESVAFAHKRGGKWITWSFHDYYNDIMRVARAFMKLGLEERHSVCISGFNSPEWFLAQMAAIFVGGIGAGLYSTNSADINRYILDDCKANILVVEEERTVSAILPFWNGLPYLKKIIVWGEKSADIEYSSSILRWEDMIEMGKDYIDLPIFERQKNMAINQCCVLIYTSGTTGNPKGVMLSHDNIYWESMRLIEFFGTDMKREVVVSYLPLSHIGGQLQDMWVALFSMSTVVFADNMALKGTLMETIREARPTLFFGVPRVWEKIMEGMQDIARSKNGVQKMIANSFKQAGRDHHLNSKDTLMYGIANKSFYPSVLQALGLDRCKGFWSGAAAIREETLYFFLGYDIMIHELYGMSETAGVHLAMSGDKPMIGSVGKPIEGLEVKLENEDSNGQGEICMRGRNIMMGYLNCKDKTTEAIDGNGWIHSGDLGWIGPKGHVYVTGRMKELIITAGGENIAPIPIENAIKEALPCISNVVVIGEKRKFLSCLLTFRVVLDNTNGQIPSDDLTAAAIAWCVSVGSGSVRLSDILAPDMAVMQAIQNGINEANKSAVSNAGVVRKWMILPNELSVSSGELGPTLKLKRLDIHKKYNTAIDKLYY